MAMGHKPLVLEIRKFGKKEFPDYFTKLWDELDARMFSFESLKEVRMGFMTSANAFGTLTLLEFTIYFAKTLVHDAPVKGMKKHVGDIIDSMLEIITNNPAGDSSPFGQFCTMMNKVHDEFGHGSLEIKKSSMRDACYFAWQKAK